MTKDGRLLNHMFHDMCAFHPSTPSIPNVGANSSRQKKAPELYTPETDSKIASTTAIYQVHTVYSCVVSGLSSWSMAAELLAFVFKSLTCT